ncbi:thioredoxin domain-containing protein [Aeromicrobium sp.]|uniref:DsbA family protein n=1 Tax=Aeromicrobium sp. TaxID=1871063 RepID=UPI0028B1D3FA|nr:thioredoxin domain-containing protein [Aeromicrobium sp.]
MTNDRQARAARAEQMRKEREKADKRQRNLITVAIVAVVVILIGAAGWGIKSMSNSNAKQQDVVVPKTLSEGDNGGFEFPATTPAADGAPVVEVYEDFLCPHCGEFESSTGALLKQQADAGAIVLRFMPMTIMDGQASEGPAHDVMNAAVCAAEQEDPAAFWSMHSALFAEKYYEGGGSPSASELSAVAEESGVADIESCIRSGEYVPWLGEAREAAQDRGVTGTPTVFVADKKIEDVSPASIQKAIDAAKKA